MRHTYKYDGDCPKKCGSKDVLMFGYCCSTEVDIVCQGCGASVRVDGSTINESQVQHTGKAELGFLGTEDIRPRFREIIDKQFGKGTAEKIMGPKPVNE